MDKSKLGEILKRHELWLKNGIDGGRADLSWADLREANLYRADLHKADLRDANLRGADLRDANLRGADLRGANLYRADLRCADLREADLRCADLREANLYRADLRGADLHKADLREADLREADADFYFSHNKIYPIICVNDYFQIGCISKDYEYFANLTKDEAIDLDGNIGVDFYRNHLPRILRAYKELRND